MFKFLKEKLKGWFKSSEEKVKEAEKPAVKLKKEEKAKPLTEKRRQEERKEIGKIQKKIDKRKRTEEERKVTQKVVEDIKKERGEDIKPIPRQEEIIEQLERGIETETEIIEQAEKKKGFFSRVFSRKYVITQEYFNEIFESLEFILIENNVALEAVDYLRNSLEKSLVNKEVDKSDLEKEIKKAFKESISSLFSEPFSILDKINGKKSSPFVIVFFGINGSGKTTTIAKLASFLKKNNISSVLAASDTFRAASIEQLKIHGSSLGTKVISQKYGSDPASVAFDAIEYARAHKIQAVLIDTAGRMHTADNLMKEMEKIVRVSKPDLRIFLGESTTGNDVVEQAKKFSESIGIDGIILSKADIDEKGGSSLSVSYVTKKPILFLGTGQEYKDLEPFDKEKLLAQLEL